MRRIQIAEIEVENIVGTAWQPDIFDLRRNFVVNYGLLIFTNDVNTQLKCVVLMQFVRLGIPVFRRQSLPIHERAV